MPSNFRVLLICSVALVPSHDGPFGSFVGTVQAEWLSDNRQMRLLQDFAYIDPSGHRWDAPKGSIVDGASIPRLAWTIIGGPFEGRYRNASVVHDVACVRKTQKWRDVHRMFYNATRLGGTNSLLAKIMYGAVYHFGPRWADTTQRLVSSKDDLLRMRQYIEDRPGVSLESIEALTSAELLRLHPVIRPEMSVSMVDTT